MRVVSVVPPGPVRAFRGPPVPLRSNLHEGVLDSHGALGLVGPRGGAGPRLGASAAGCFAKSANGLVRRVVSVSVSSRRRHAARRLSLPDRRRLPRAESTRRWTFAPPRTSSPLTSRPHCSNQVPLRKPNGPPGPPQTAVNTKSSLLSGWIRGFGAVGVEGLWFQWTPYFHQLG